MKTALVCGAGGFIGSHLVKRLKAEGYFVRGADLKKPEFGETAADDFVVVDLRDGEAWKKILDLSTSLETGRPIDEVYQLAADMGGMGFIGTGEHDADIMHNSASINLNAAHYCHKMGIEKIFYSSSACIYPIRNQMDPQNPMCEESSAYPADPDSEYGWEKLFSERIYFAFHKNFGLDVKVARFHNIFGPDTAWDGERAKAPAAICRKVVEARDGGAVEIWGDGTQTRSFLYVDECVEGILRFMRTEGFNGPLNIGSEEIVTINELTEMVIGISGKKLSIKHIPGPLGVKGRNSHNELIRKKLNWEPSMKLKDGMAKMYEWVLNQVKSNSK